MTAPDERSAPGGARVMASAAAREGAQIIVSNVLSWTLSKTDPRKRRELEDEVERALFAFAAARVAEEGARETRAADADALRTAVDDALVALGAACRRGHLRMTIPVDEARDDDSVIGRALHMARDLLAAPSPARPDGRDEATP